METKEEEEAPKVEEGEGVAEAGGEDVGEGKKKKRKKDKGEELAATELENADLGVELFEKAVDWTVSGKYAQWMKGRQMVAELVRGTVTRCIKKGTMSQMVVDFIQDEEEWGDFEEGEAEDMTEDELDWNRMIREETMRRSTDLQQHTSLRSRLLQRVYQLKDQGVILNIRNLLLQRKVAEISIAKRTSHADKQKVQGLQTFSAIGIDPKVRYRDTLQQYGELRKTLDDVSRRFDKELNVLRDYRDAVEAQVQQETEKLHVVFKTEVAQLRCSLTGRAMDDKQAEELLSLIERKLMTMKKEHIRFVQTSQRLKDTLRRIATLEMYGDHTKLEDYEQLFEDNQKLEERIEERGEVIVALREKAVRELQEAAHMRDMMHGTEEDIEALVLQLDAVDDRLSRGRDAVAKSKRRRDEIRRRTKKLVEDLELLAFPELLSHFQKLRKLTAHAEAWLRSLVRACAVQEEGIRRVRARMLDLSKRYRGIIPDSVLRMLQLQIRGDKDSHGMVVAGSSDSEVEALPSRFTFSF